MGFLGRKTILGRRKAGRQKGDRRETLKRSDIWYRAEITEPHDRA